MFSKAFLIFALVLLMAAPAALAHRSDNIPNPPLQVWANKGPVLSGAVRGLLFARSATDMPVPYVKVIVTTCRYGQQLPFEYNLGRTLDNSFETVKASNDGRTITWRMFSAPPNTGMPTRLPIQFTLAQNKGGPTFCVLVHGWTNEGTKPTATTRLVWQLG
jgi:hypothetical protein